MKLARRVLYNLDSTLEGCIMLTGGIYILFAAAFMWARGEIKNSWELDL